jgi:GrpB-like predicted nucleotidyltransferase (UPF0157 family)
MSSRTIAVVEYDPSWPTRFAALAARVAAAFAAPPAIPVRVEHVGSTAVPGLAAKPVIDLDAVVAPTDAGRAAARLAALGYAPKGDQGLPGREAFRPPPGEDPHHLYLCTPDAPAYRDHLRFRDHLRAHPRVAAEYGALKRALAERHAGDRDAYQAAKGAFVAAVTASVTDAATDTAADTARRADPG